MAFDLSDRLTNLTQLLVFPIDASYVHHVARGQAYLHPQGTTPSLIRLCNFNSGLLCQTSDLLFQLHKPNNKNLTSSFELTEAHPRRQGH